MGCTTSNSVVSPETSGYVSEDKKNGYKPAGNFDEITKWKSSIDSLLNNSTLTNYAKSKKRSNFSSFDDLKQFLKNSPAKNDTQKGWVIYVWVANNIDYDAKGYFSGNYGDLSPEGVFKSGVGVCSGYARIFKNLCDYVGVECVCITGYAKGYSHKPDHVFKDTNHEWNAIKVDGKWQLVDSTWGAGNLVGSKFERKFTPYYFFTPQNVLIYSHFPIDQQFKPKDINLDTFNRMQKLKNKFFLANLKCLTHDLSKEIKVNKNTLKIDFSCSSEYDINGRLESVNGKTIENALLIRKNPFKSIFEINVSIPPKQNGIIILFTKSKTQEKSEWAGEIFIQSSGSDPQIQWSTVYGINTNVYLVKPLELRCKKGSTQTFEVYYENAVNAALIDSKNNFIYLTRSQTNSKMWSTEYKIENSGKLGLAAKLIENDSFHCSHMFEVV